MKKWFFTSSVLLLAIILSACLPSNLFKSDSQIINEQFDRVLKALNEKDGETLKSLFSKNAIETDVDFDENLQLLFQYYEGNNSSYIDDGPLVASKSRDYDCEQKSIEKSYDVTTSENTYRLAVNLVVTDDTDNDNIGIWSLYIIKAADDSDPECSYWGDGKNTPGINISSPRPEQDQIYDTPDYVDSRTEVRLSFYKCLLRATTFSLTFSFISAIIKD
jgi:hypothetical protein